MMSSVYPEAPTLYSGDSHTMKSLSGLQSLEGYEYEFDPPVDARFECPICLLVLREPSQTKCGHRFCRDCILRTLKNSSSRCPIDNEPLTEADIYPDNYAKREILNCTIKCPNREGGCEKIFPLCELKAHLQVCQFTLIPCPNKCGCILPQRDVDSHVEKACGLRIVMCTCCGANIHAHLTQEHVIVCPKVPVKCENCQQEMTRDMLKVHLQTVCENVIVRCPFYTLGCGSSMKRRSEDQHLMEDGAAHLRQLCGAVTHILAQMNLQKQQVEHIAHSLDMSHGSMPGRIEDSGAWLTHTSAAAGSSFLNQIVSVNKDKSHHQNQSAPQCDNPSSNAALPFANFMPASSGATPQLSTGPHDREPYGGSPHPSSLPTRAVNSKDVQKPGARSMPFMDMTTNQNNNETVENGTAQATSHPSGGIMNTHPLASAVNGLAATATHPNINSSYSANGLAVDVAGLNLNSPYCGVGLPGHTNPKNIFPLQTASTVINSEPNYGPNAAANTIPLVFSMMEQVTAEFDKKLEARNKEITELKSTVMNLKKQNVALYQAVVGFQENILSKTYNGRFYWKIPEYTRHKQQALQGEHVVFYSESFYTSPWGYKMCLRASITALKSSDDGATAQQHLSLFIHVMQGDNDSILPWPFSGKILLALLDQNKNEAYRKPVQETIEAKPSLAAFQRPAQPRNQKGFGFTEFLPVDKLEAGTYLVGDCLLIHAHVFTPAG